MEKKIKLFVDAHSFDKEYQGVRTFIKEIYNILLEHYPSLDIFFGATNVEQIRADFPLVKEDNIIRYKSSIGLLRFFNDIPEILQKHEIDFAHFQYLVPVGKKSCVYIVTTHDILFNDFKSDFSFLYRYLRNLLFRRGIQKSDIKTTVSEYSKSRIEHYFHVPRESIHVIPNGVNPQFSKRFQSNSEAAAYISSKYDITNYILYVSRIEPRKNHLALLNTYINGKLYNQGISLVFIGKESIPVKELNESLNGLPFEQKRQIHLIPQVDQDDLEAFYKGCRVFAYVSKAEGFGIPPLEAAIAEVPVLCSNTTAMREFDFFTPYLFDPYNPDDMGEKMRLLLDSAPNPLRLNAVANEVLRRYSWENSARRLFTLITSYKPRPDINGSV